MNALPTDCLAAVLMACGFKHLVRGENSLVIIFSSVQQPP